MGILDDLEARTAARLPGTPCFVGRALSMLPSDEDREVMREALDRRQTITATVLRDHFRETYRVEVGDQSIRKHRNGQCRCRLSTS